MLFFIVFSFLIIYLIANNKIINLTNIGKTNTIKFERICSGGRPIKNRTNPVPISNIGTKYNKCLYEKV